MQPLEPHSVWKARLLRRLAVVTDHGHSYRVRLAATRAVQAMLGPGISISEEDVSDLLERALNPWDRRPELRGGRYVEVQVKRPPEGIRDVWA